MKRWLVGAVCLALGAAGLGLACASSSSNGSGGSAACGNLVSAYCNKFNECSPDEITGEFGDVSGCVSRTSLSCAGFDQLPGTSWTPEKIQGCTAVINASTCQDLTQGITSDACKTGPGSLANGSPCGDSAQCAGGSCNKSPSSDAGASAPNVFCGVCATAAPPCRDAGTCSGTQRCVYDSTSGYSCVTLAAEGAACAAGMPCASGLTCKSNVCAKRGGKDSPCQTSSDCDSSLGLYCIGATCQKPTLVGAGQACPYPGSRCSAGLDCISSYSADGGSTSACVAHAEDKAPCDDGKGPRCLSPARCLNGVCTVPDYAQCE